MNVENDRKYDYRVICDFGNKPPLKNGKFDCTCGKEYGYLAIELRKYCRDKYKMLYSQDITSDMGREFYICNLNKK